MPKVKQLTAWVKGAPGRLARIAKALEDGGVNITSFTAYGTGAHCPVRLQVSSLAKAKRILQEIGVRTTEEEVLRITVPDQPGLLARITGRLAQADINVEYAYATSAAGRAERVDVVLGVSDVAGAERALRGL
jgi:hypothetical protein